MKNGRFKGFGRESVKIGHVFKLKVRARGTADQDVNVPRPVWTRLHHELKGNRAFQLLGRVFRVWAAYWALHLPLVVHMTNAGRLEIQPSYIVVRSIRAQLKVLISRWTLWYQFVFRVYLDKRRDPSRRGWEYCLWLGWHDFARQ